MKQKLNTEHYSRAIAEKLNIDKKQVHKILITCLKRLGKFMKEGNDVVVDNFIEIRTNKQSRINYIKKVKEAKKNEN